MIGASRAASLQSALTHAQPNLRRGKSCFSSDETASIASSGEFVPDARVGTLTDGRHEFVREARGGAYPPPFKWSALRYALGKAYRWRFSSGDLVEGSDVSLYLPLGYSVLAIACGCLLALTGWLWGPSEFVVAGTALALALAWAAMVDVHRFVLPDILTLGLVALGLVIHALSNPTAVAPYVIGATGGYLSLLLVAVLYRKRRGRAGLGMGDAKLFAAAGAWLGWISLPSVLLIATVSAITYIGAAALVSRRIDLQRPLPFGPFIAMGLWVVWIIGPLTNFATGL